METLTFVKPVVFTTSEPPVETKNGWLVLNASRPLYGTKVWQGEFLEGIFYAAIDPSDQPYSDDALYESLMLDARPVVHITEAEVVEWVKQWCEREGYDFSIVEGDVKSIRQHLFCQCKLEWEFTFEDKKLVGQREQPRNKVKGMNRMEEEIITYTVKGSRENYEGLKLTVVLEEGTIVKYVVVETYCEVPYEVYRSYPVLISESDFNKSYNIVNK